MDVTTLERPITTEAAAPVVQVRRRSIDKVLIGMGLAAAIVFAVAGGLLMWGSNFAGNYVHDELSSQKVFFPAKAELVKQGRTDLAGFAGQQVTNKHQAQTYTSFINGHLQTIGNGKTYSQIDDRNTAQTVTDAKDADKPGAEVAK